MDHGLEEDQVRVRKDDPVRMLAGDGQILLFQNLGARVLLLDVLARLLLEVFQGRGIGAGQVRDEQLRSDGELPGLTELDDGRPLPDVPRSSQGRTKGDLMIGSHRADPEILRRQEEKDDPPGSPHNYPYYVRPRAVVKEGPGSCFKRAIRGP